MNSNTSSLDVDEELIFKPLEKLRRVRVSQMKCFGIKQFRIKN